MNEQIKTQYPLVLNAPHEMQGSLLYRARKDVLASAEQIITHLEQLLNEAIADRSPSYQRQFNEMCAVWGPVEEYARKHPKLQLGDSISAFIVERMKELDRIEGKQS